MKEHIKRYKHHYGAGLAVALIVVIALALRLPGFSAAQAAPTLILDGTGVNCATVGTWTPGAAGRGGTCTLNTDLNGPVEIQANSIVLDCKDATTEADHLITGDGTGYGVLLDSRFTSTVQNCDISNFQVGIYGLNVDDVHVLNNTIHDNTMGVQLRNSGNTLANFVSDNLVSNNATDGIQIVSSFNSNITNNVVSGGINGIYGNYASSGVITDNTVYGNSNHGISLVDSLVSIARNTLSNNTNAGITLDYPTLTRLVPIVIRQNEVSGSGAGIQLKNAPGHTVTANNLFANTLGLEAINSNGLIVSSNELHDNLDAGTRLESTVNSTFTDNTYENNQTAVRATLGSNENTFYTNTFSDNGTGVVFESSTDNLSYNNFFQNDVNVTVDAASTGNQWATLGWDGGENVIFRNVTATTIGNYWSDITDKTDANEDGIADAPHTIDPGNVDPAPLVLYTWADFDSGSISGDIAVRLVNFTSGSYTWEVSALNGFTGSVMINGSLVTLPYTGGTARVGISDFGNTTTISALNIFQSLPTDDAELTYLEQYRYDSAVALAVLANQLCNTTEPQCTQHMLDAFNPYISLPVPNTGDTAMRLQSLEQYRHDSAVALAVLANQLCNATEPGCFQHMVDTFDPYISFPVPNTGDIASRLASLEQYRYDSAVALSILANELCNATEPGCFQHMVDTFDPYTSSPVPSIFVGNVFIGIELDTENESIQIQNLGNGQQSLINNSTNARVESLEQYRHDSAVALAVLANQLCNTTEPQCTVHMLNAFNPYTSLPVLNTGDTAMRLASLEQYRHDSAVALAVLANQLCNTTEPQCTQHMLDAFNPYISLPVPNTGDTAMRLASLEQYRYDSAVALAVLANQLCNTTEPQCTVHMLNAFNPYTTPPDSGFGGLINVNLFDGFGQKSMGVTLAAANDGFLHSFDEGSGSFTLEALTNLNNISLYQQGGQLAASLQRLESGMRVNSATDDESGLGGLSVELGNVTLKMVNALNVPTGTLEADAGDSVRLGASLASNTILVDSGSVLFTGLNSRSNGIVEGTLDAGSRMISARNPYNGGLTLQNSGTLSTNLSLTGTGTTATAVGIGLAAGAGTAAGVIATLVDNDDNNQTPPTPVGPYCGDNICQDSETQLTCPADCSADFVVVPETSGVTVSCDSASTASGDQCYAVRAELVTEGTAERIPVNVSLRDSADTQTMQTRALADTATFDSATLDGAAVSDVAAVALAPSGARIDGNGLEIISCGAQTLQKGVVNLVVRYVVNGAQMCQPPTPGGDVTEDNYVDLHIIDQAKTGACGGAGSCKLPLAGADVRVFDRAVIGNPSGSTYDQVYESGTGLVSTCTTDNTGMCTATEDAAGNYLVIVKYYDAETGNTVYTGLPKGYEDFVDTNGDGTPDHAEKHFQFIKVYKKNGSIQWSGGKKTVVTGSQLDIIYPSEAIWDEGAQSFLYPFIFTSDDNWEVDVCSQVPAGYEIQGVYDENGDLITTDNCYETFVSGETKVVAFDVVDVGSPPVWAMKTKLKVKHNGKNKEVDVEIPTKVKGKDKEKKDKKKS